MKLPSLPRLAGTLLATALLGGCANGVPSSTIVPTTGSTSLRQAGLPRDASWISPGAASAHTLVYVAMNGEGGVGFYGVEIFAWPSLKLVGKIAHYGSVGGACSDSNGNVYIILNGYATSTFPAIEKFSHGGKLLSTYTDSNGRPNGCAVNPQNGDLAVTNFLGLGYCGESCWYPGNLVVYSSPSSPPTVYTNSTEQNYFYPAYDPKGNLWETGGDNVGTTWLYSCASGSCNETALSGATIHFPAGLQWVKSLKSLMIFDAACNRPSSNSGSCGYLVSSQGLLSSKTTYDNFQGGATCNIGQAVLAPNGKSVVSGDGETFCGYTPSTLDAWAYPAGGNPTTYRAFKSNYAFPTGIAFSTKG